MNLIIRKRDNTSVCTISSVLSIRLKEKLTTEKTLSIQAIISGGLENLNDTDNYTVQYGDDYYDIVKIKKELSSGLYKITLECEHVSYRLTSYTKTAFTKTGTPREILSTLLHLTEFTVGDVEPTGSFTYSLSSNKTKRAAILDFCNYIGCEAEFNGFDVNIKNHRGKTERYELFEKNVVSISKTIDNSKNKSYSVSIRAPVNLRLGDEVHMKFDMLQIDENVRIVGITKDPFTSKDIQLEVENYLPSITRDTVSFESATVTVDKSYYGTTISEDDGLTITRSDNKAKVVFNADELSMKSEDNTGALIDRLYFDPVSGNYKFVGTVKIDGGEINIGDNFVVDQDGNVHISGDSTIYGGKYYAGTPGAKEGFLQMTSTGFEVYNKDTDVKLRLGYTSVNEDYPFLQLGSGSGVSTEYGLVKKFDDGLWIGNSVPADESGSFKAKEGYNGIFFSFLENTAYIVKNDRLKNIYTGTAFARFA